MCLIACSFFFACSNNEDEMKDDPKEDKFTVYSDGKTLTTLGLQKLIDDCAQKGGGVVSLKPGVYLTGTLTLRNNVTLNLEKGAKILGSRDPKDYPAAGRKKSLIFAEKVNNIAITGEGEIDGSGSAFHQENDTPNRPTLILLFDCKNVIADGVKLLNSGFWTFRFVRCDGVEISNMHIEGHATWNNDGFDIESKNVTIKNCMVDTDDDAICFKSEDKNFVVENITVTDCELSSNCNFIKFGTASAGGFRNIKVSNCKLHKCSQSKLRFWNEKYKWLGVDEPITGLAGVALEVVDGGFMEEIELHDLTMDDVQTPVFIRLGKRKTSDNSYLKDVWIHDIQATSVSLVASSITGVPGLRVDNVKISDIDLKLKGGGLVKDTNVNVPEKEGDYPENRMFGQILPGYGFYIRHADNIIFENINLSIWGNEEERYAIYADDVHGLSVENSEIQKPSGSLPKVYTKDCTNINIPNDLK